MTLSLGLVIAAVVLLVAIVLLVTGALPPVLGLLIAGLAVARLVP
jgi:hypothetical protein